MFQKNDLVMLNITGMTSEGNGVGRANGIAVFVPAAAVGDRIEARIVKVHKSYCYGKIERLLVSSPDRIETDCSVSLPCGGCCYRHITYESELQLKEQVVKDAFWRLGGIDVPHLPICGAEKPNEYRNKAQFPVGTDKDGHLFAGFYAARSHRIIPCNDCRLHPPIFETIKQIVLRHLNTYQIPAYDEQTGQGLVRHICIRSADQTGEIMVTIVAAKMELPHADILCNELNAAVPQVVSVILNYNPARNNVILGNVCKTLFGKDHITDILCGCKIKLSPLSFYQVNHDQAERLYQIAQDFAALTGKETLVDLYCGAGTIGLSMANAVRRLIGVEIIPEAVENAKQNAAYNRIRHAEFFCADAAQATQNLRLQSIRPDVVVVDPPRKGCTASVLSDIAEMGPDRIVMVSCNPSTAARDCALLEQKGYQVKQVQAVDLFPRTAHVETVVCLKRRTR